jgi:hypothetical protein
MEFAPTAGVAEHPHRCGLIDRRGGLPTTVGFQLSLGDA